MNMPKVTRDFEMRKLERNIELFPYYLTVSVYKGILEVASRESFGFPKLGDIANRIFYLFPSQLIG
jgi:hypothetical protein